MKLLLALLISLAFISASQARIFRDFTNTQGVTIHAELLDLREGKVRIRSNNQVFDIPLEQLTADDQKWLAEWDLKRQGNEEVLYYQELVFEDDFSGDGFGEKWSHYKSESVVADGILVGKTIDINDHAGVDAIRFEGRQDMEVSVKFKFGGPEAERFNVWFDDKEYQGSHAGHICSISISPTGGSISDAKTGSMENAIYEMKKSAEGIDEPTRELLEEKTHRFELDLEDDKDEWHALVIRTEGDTAVVLVDGEEVGSLSSEGIAHATKSVVSLTTNVNDVHYDDFSIKAAPLSDEPPADEKN